MIAHRVVLAVVVFKRILLMLVIFVVTGTLYAFNFYLGLCHRVVVVGSAPLLLLSVHVRSQTILLKLQCVARSEGHAELFGAHAPFAVGRATAAKDSN